MVEICKLFQADGLSERRTNILTRIHKYGTSTVPEVYM